MLNQLKIKQHPDKTYIGKIEKGFDFLGYHFSHTGLAIATKSILVIQDSQSKKIQITPPHCQILLHSTLESSKAQQ
jgi:hypothetical protein